VTGELGAGRGLAPAFTARTGAGGGSAAGGPLASRRRLVSGLADQVVSSGTNFLTSLLTARLLAPDEFGQVVIALTVGALAVAAGRATVGDVLLSLEPSADEAARGRVVSDALSAAVLIGIGALVLGLLAGRLSAPAALAIGAVGVWTPAVVVQDALRYVAFRDQRPERALALDLVWALAQLAGVAVLLLTGRVGMTSLIACWGFGALCAAAAGPRIVRIGPFVRIGPPVRWPGLLPRGTRRWLRRTRHLRGWYAGQTLLSQLQGQVVVWTVGAILGTSAVGGLRAVQTLLMMPVSSALLAVQSLIVPAMARHAAAGDLAGLRRSTVRLTWVFGAAAGTVGLAACLLRRPLIDAVFTSHFAAYDTLMFPVAATAFCFAVTMPFAAACRGTQNARAVFGLQTSFTVVVVPACIVGAVLFGIDGSAWGMPVAGLAQIVLSRRVFRARLAAAPARPALAAEDAPSRI
jgi:O-antigen/teichoic acid export membrane protein